MIEIYRWRQLDRWDAFTIPHLHAAPHLPQVRIGDLLMPRQERVNRAEWRFDQLQPITIHFGGEISRRKTAEGTDYSLSLFWARPGDVVLSKIDLKNGAVGVLPEGWENVVVTSHFKVYTPDTNRLDARFFRQLLQTRDFKNWLWANRSGADGRTEVKLDVFEMLEIPLPPIREQAALCDAYSAGLDHAARLEQEAQAIEDTALRAFETALGLTPPPPLPERPVFVARFKDLDRWGHESVLWRQCKEVPTTSSVSYEKLRNVIDDIEVGWSPKCLERSATVDEWGVLKLSAVTRTPFAESENKALPKKFAPREELEVKPGDVLITRGSGITRLVGAAVFVEHVRPKLMICDLIFRVQFGRDSTILPEFLASVLRTPGLRKQIEERRTGAAPMMQKITKSALLDVMVPVPTLEEQQSLLNEVTVARRMAHAKRAQAQTLRASAWTAFESALFTTNDSPESHACGSTRP